MKRIFVLLNVFTYCTVAIAQHPYSKGGNPLYWALVGGISAGLYYAIFRGIPFIMSLFKRRENNNKNDDKPLNNDEDFKDDQSLNNVPSEVIYSDNNSPKTKNEPCYDNPDKCTGKVKNKFVMYCKHCGKEIDADSLYCRYCGKKQNAQDAGVFTSKVLSRFKEAITGFVKNTCSVIKNPMTNSGLTDRGKLKKWAKRISLLILALVVIGLIVLLGFWLYGFYQTSKWEKNDKRREAIALKDISKANKIAKELFKEDANGSHIYDFDGSECGFDHIERGIELICNAAEKGDAEAQFTLGCIYAGVRLDSQSPYWGSTTMMGGEINHERAAYWYHQAAAQGNPGALNNLANAYRKGIGVEQDLVKAAELLRSAAEKGAATAQLNYGDMCRDGEVWLKAEDQGGGYFIAITKKPMIEEAKKWWSKVLENDEADDDEKARAKERLEKIYE